MGLSKPRPAGIGSSTFAPSLKVSSETRSWAASNELMNVLAASLTAPHCGPIELDTSSTSDRSTILRVASPVLATVTVLILATLMNVVGMTAVAVTVTTLTPVAGLTAEVKKLAAAVGSGAAAVPRYPGGKFALKIWTASARGLPLLRARAAASAAPSTALLNCAFTT